VIPRPSHDHRTSPERPTGIEVYRLSDDGSS
jgi:hypothetical protein